jgi:hypothetical protein
LRLGGGDGGDVVNCWIHDSMRAGFIVGAVPDPKMNVSCMVLMLMMIKKMRAVC